MKHFLMFYDFVDDCVSKRAAYRSAHLQQAWEAHARGELLLGGALAEPVDGAVLLFAGETPGVAEEFARSDPYVLNGLVLRWRVREWSTGVGAMAVTRVKP